MAAVLFQIHAAAPLTADDRYVAVVGNVSELGAWDVAKAVPLKKHVGTSTLWEATLEVAMYALIEYKYIVLDRAGGLVLWESLPGNRTRVAGGTNVALHKPVTQSSIFVAPAGPVPGPRVPELAVNGNTSGHFEHMCCRTNVQDQPYWQVDLLASTPLAKLVLWNRQDMFLDRLVPVWLLLSNTPFGDVSLEAAKKQALASMRFASAATQFEWPVTTTARYVRVQHEAAHTSLQFAQLQAFTPTHLAPPVLDGWFGLDNRALGDGQSHIDGQWLAPGATPELRLIFGSFDKKPSVTFTDKVQRSIYLQARVLGHPSTSIVHAPYSADLRAIDVAMPTPHLDRELLGNALPLPTSLSRGLDHVSLLTTLPPHVRHELTAKLERISFVDAQPILSIGQDRHHLLLVDAGVVAVTGPTTTQGTATFLELGPGAYFGELALVSGANRSAQVVAKGAVTLSRLHRDDFAAVLAAHGLDATSLLAAHADGIAASLPLLTTTPSPKTPFVAQDTLQVFRLGHLPPSASVAIEVVDVATETVLGTSVLVASQLHRTNGAVSTPLLSPSFAVVGELLLRYLHIRPFVHKDNTLASAFRTQWLHGPALDMGHRGLGRSYYQAFGYRTSHIRENTLASFVVAGLHGADWIEFDVQLSKDRIPVVYHDFFFKAALEDRRGRSPAAFTKTGLHDLTLAQLNNVQWRHGKSVTDGPRLQHLVRKHWLKLVQPKAKKPSPPTTTTTTTLPTSDVDWAALSERFPTLENLLTHVPPYVGLNVEIKYPVDPPDAASLRSLDAFEMNAYLDAILACIFEHANGRRNIVFSCFEPDVCVMLRAKQTRYPVFFLTCGTDITGQVPDVRTVSLETAVPFSRMEQLQGIVTNSLPLFTKPKWIRHIRNDQLHLWTWGNHNTGHDKVQFQKMHGVSGVISDNVGDLTKVDKKLRPRDAGASMS
ncbi:hypothetical protein SPRG_11756 [Saprolegnia parasitica CBS 223.65]|uniref:Glycerophosphodiesterase n=2 Tax=Saprolegnia parasitica (strain CBS 223.65) TaxID=695850 RepID=A0A067C7W9_SAPPC|nr:hypothetical protein SPRG_11756 [Saprolegnia parasitica CBS 223.65]KDO22912.1 hypothetical protein SPRG_11756 [Saprolegnia parasitica CBS 223.65]|eukprot:XP_012206349.1 hypothetical protein SPRG_11756 [Saprolegnia parasitica CBS 223.65]